ncbi:MAG: biliverdin-producing heme oxygenase [Proteobacteria bacterium]|nr:biliverdin-producing heme oxygenase [Pseudomonadota bacterium]
MSSVRPIHTLREATWPLHVRLERRLDVAARFGSLPAYREHLRGMWGFCAGIESRLPAEVLSGVLPDYGRRRKLPPLTRDLLALEECQEAIGRLPVCGQVPAADDPASALGCLYVLEGASLGGQVLLPVVRERIGVDADRGAEFLAAYGTETPAMWQRFGAVVDEACAGGEARERAVDAAQATFAALEHWLCGPAA